MRLLASKQAGCIAVYIVLGILRGEDVSCWAGLTQLNLPLTSFSMRERGEANVKCESSFDAVQSQSFDVPRDLILVSIQSPCKLCSRPSKVGE